MLHRNARPDDIHAGKWNGLGGKLDPGESPEECVTREVREESGLDISDPELKGILTFPGFNKDVDWYVFVYTVHTFHGAIGECPEGCLEWVDDARIPSLNLWEGDRIFLKWLEGDRFFSGKFTYDDGRLVDHSVVFH